MIFYAIMPCRHDADDAIIDYAIAFAIAACRHYATPRFSCCLMLPATAATPCHAADTRCYAFAAAIFEAAFIAMLMPYAARREKIRGATRCRCLARAIAVTLSMLLMMQPLSSPPAMIRA